MAEIIPDPDIKEFDGVYGRRQKAVWPSNEYNLSRLGRVLTEDE